MLAVKGFGEHAMIESGKVSIYVCCVTGAHKKKIPADRNPFPSNQTPSGC
jgi:hypothetical protein